MSDPFARHPELRDLIKPASQSGFRTQSMADTLAWLSKAGIRTDWFYSDAEREAIRLSAFTGRPDEDLWVFAYGSLMWDPALEFTDVRRAFVPGYSRQFILKDTLGGRGTEEAPGVMAALDHGAGCDGLAFRIAARDIEGEAEILWRRECIGPGYHPVFVPAERSDETVEVLTFQADHNADLICSEITRDEQVRYLATRTKLFGSSLEYIANIIEHFEAMGIDDPHIRELQSAALDYIAELAG